MRIKFFYLFAIPILIACGSNSGGAAKNNEQANNDSVVINDSIPVNNKGYKVIHVFVALCDNKYQGIVPVSATIGNGQDPARNLYWGAAYGIKSYFKKSNEWVLLKTFINPAENIPERLLFKHKASKTIMIADAYDGQFIRQATTDFLSAASGDKITIVVNSGDSIYGAGASDLIAYIGHDGLMDFDLNEKFSEKRKSKKEAIILACYSKNYFSSHLRQTGAIPLLWTNGLMAPEAYTLHDAIEAWINSKTGAEIRMAAAKAYSRYQKCSIKAAYNLFAQGW